MVSTTKVVFLNVEWQDFRAIPLKLISAFFFEVSFPVFHVRGLRLLHRSHQSSDPVDETRALSETRARQLMGMPVGDSLLDLRDRAILKFCVSTGARIETGCKLNVSDFHQDGYEATLRFQLKGARAKTKGIHFSAPEAILPHSEFWNAPFRGIMQKTMIGPEGLFHSLGTRAHRSAGLWLVNNGMNLLTRL